MTDPKIEDAVIRRATEKHRPRDCDNLSLATASGDAERVYCETCGAVLLKWGAA